MGSGFSSRGNKYQPQPTAMAGQLGVAQPQTSLPRLADPSAAPKSTAPPQTTVTMHHMPVLREKDPPSRSSSKGSKDPAGGERQGSKDRPRNERQGSKDWPGRDERQGSKSAAGSERRRSQTGMAAELSGDKVVMRRSQTGLRAGRSSTLEPGAASGHAQDDGMHGFSYGDRVIGEGQGGREMGVGTVLGPGAVPGTVAVKMHSNNLEWNIKAVKLQKLNPTQEEFAHKITQRVEDRSVDKKAGKFAEGSGALSRMARRSTIG